MLLKTFLLSVTSALALFVLTPDVFAWGCSRSSSASGRYGGSYSHSSSSSGDDGSYSHSGSGNYGYGGGTYHGSTSGGASYNFALLLLRLLSVGRFAAYRGTLRRFFCRSGWLRPVRFEVLSWSFEENLESRLSHANPAASTRSKMADSMSHPLLFLSRRLFAQ
jgi:hypothetical protein